MSSTDLGNKLCFRQNKSIEYTNFTLESDYNEGGNPTVMTKLICKKEEKKLNTKRKNLTCLKQFLSIYLLFFQDADTVAEGRIKNSKGLANSYIYGDLGEQPQSHMTHEKNHIMKESRKNQNEMLDNTNHGEITSFHRECLFIEVVINHTTKVAGQKMEC